MNSTSSTGPWSIGASFIWGSKASGFSYIGSHPILIITHTRQASLPTHLAPVKLEEVAIHVSKRHLRRVCVVKNKKMVGGGVRRDNPCLAVKSNRAYKVEVDAGVRGRWCGLALVGRLRLHTQAERGWRDSEGVDINRGNTVENNHKHVSINGRKRETGNQQYILSL